MSDYFEKKYKKPSKARNKKLEENDELTINTKKERGLEFIPDYAMPEELESNSDELKSTYNSTLYYQKVTKEFLNSLLTRMQDLALKGDHFCIKYFLGRSLRAEPEINQYKFEGLKGLNNLEKISHAFELSFQALGEGKISYKESNDLAKSLTSYSTHLRETKQIVSLTEKIDLLAQGLIKICSASDLKENEELRSVLNELKNSVSYED